jgi:hypothetical protein
MSGVAQLQPGDRVGLCRRCRLAQRVPTPALLYWMCRRSLTDPAYPKYPRLPVGSCPGFEPGEPAGSPEAPAPD